jgi:hypothetical protein
MNTVYIQPLSTRSGARMEGYQQVHTKSLERIKAT